MIFFNKSKTKLDSDDYPLLRRQLEAVQTVSHELINQQNLDQTLETIVKQLISKLNYVNPSIYIIDKDSKNYQIKKVNVAKVFIKLAEKIIGKSIYDVKFSLENDNLLSESIKSDKVLISDNMYDLLKPQINKSGAYVLQKSLNVKKIVVLPIKLDNILIGSLAIASKKSEVSDNEINVLKTFSDQISIAIFNSQQNEARDHQLQELQKKNEDLQSLYEMTSEISKHLIPQNVLDTAVEEIPTDENLIGNMIFSYNKKDKKLELASFSTLENEKEFYNGFSSDFKNLDIKTDKMSFTESSIGKVLNNKKPLTHDDISTLFGIQFGDNVVNNLKRAGVNAWGAYPIVSHNKSLGVIVYLFRKKETFEQMDPNSEQLLFTYALQIGVSLDNANLYEHSQKIQNNLKKALADLQEARRKERDMIDVMGHELRTPITIVRNSLQMLDIFEKAEKKEIDRVKLREYLDIALESTNREMTLIETLLTATKVDASRIQLSQEKVDMLDVINDGIEGQKNQAKNKGLEIHWEKPRGEYSGYADRVRIQEVMDNFLSNAVKYTHKGYIEITIEKLKKEIKINVKDTGMGISEDDIKNLGKKFFRAKQYINGDEGVVRPGGTGLGLYVVFGLVEGMGGKIDISSKVGKGSIFSFSVPIYKGQKIVKYDEKFNKQTKSIIKLEDYKEELEKPLNNE